MKATVLDSILQIGERTIDLLSPIGQIVSADGKHFVRLELSGALLPLAYKQNVFCFDDMGTMLWQIQALPDSKSFSHG